MERVEWAPLEAMCCTAKGHRDWGVLRQLNPKAEPCCSPQYRALPCKQQEQILKENHFTVRFLLMNVFLKYILIKL